MSVKTLLMPRLARLACTALVLGGAGLLVSCGGGGGGGGSVAAPAAAATPAPVEGLCALPAVPARPANVVDVRSFGAVPDDGRDDTQAIQAALNALAPGQWLVFAPGTYQHHSRLMVKTAGAVLWSEGATLHATNPDDQAVMLAADGAALYNFTLTAVTSERLNAPWHSRIAVFDPVPRSTPLRDNVVQGNRVINAGAPGTATANSASSAGIYVDHAENFLVAGNEVRRSLSDGIHVTAGARNGRVIFNTVVESGDDLIGLVSYMGEGGWAVNPAAGLAGTLAAQRDRQLVRNVFVGHNDVSGNYWGRGIAVVGGADITVSNNRIARTAIGAGVLLARDASFVTWGLDNVLVQDNTISQVQTTAPAYVPQGWDRNVVRTGHGAVEIHAFIFDDERAYADIVEAAAVQNVSVQRTSVVDAYAEGVRVGVGTGVVAAMQAIDGNGQLVRRSLGGGTVRRIDLSSVAMTGTALPALQILARTTTTDNVYCEGLSDGGRAVSHPACGGVRPAVTGSARSCTR